MQEPHEPQMNETNGQLIPPGAGVRAREWLADLLNQVYQAHGADVLQNPMVQGIKGILPMAAGMVPALRPLSTLLSTVETSGPGALVANLQLSDDDAVKMLELFHAALVDGYRVVLNVDVTAE